MFDRIAFAVQSDCVRRPIRLRPPSNQIASAVRLDCVRRPIGLRSPPDWIASAIYSYNHRLYTLSIKSYSNTYCCLLRRPETSATVFVCTDSLSSTAYCCRFAFLCLCVDSVSEAQVQIVVNIVCGVLLALEG
jgi:hypothetical protein